MIVADANVLSEPLRREPDPRVLAWLESIGPEVAITTVTAAELLFGALRLPEGRRRATLIDTINRLIEESGDRLLGFDEAAARAYASLRVAREAAGRPVAVEDLMIGSICLARGLPLATRNVRHFDGFAIDVVNPWDFDERP